MVNIELTTESDLPQIQEWIDQDFWHKGQDANFWLSGQALLSFRLHDEVGNILYCRLDFPVDDKVRIHLQFAPEEIVSKHRLVTSMLTTMPTVFDYVKTKASAVVFESVNPSLIAFFEHRGFVRTGKTDDFVLNLGSIPPATTEPAPAASAYVN